MFDDVMLVYKDERKLDTIHYGRFWYLLTQNYLRQISILSTNKQKIRKNKGTYNVPEIESCTN